VCFATEFLAELAIRFEALDTKYKFYRYTGVELSDDEYALPAKQFGADEVLWVKEKYSHILIDPGFMGLFSSEEVTDYILGAYIPGHTENEEAAWQALIKVGEGTGGWSLKARLAASSLVDKLVADGLMGGGSAHQQ
jgi:hypothetical protein